MWNLVRVHLFYDKSISAIKRGFIIGIHLERNTLFWISIFGELDLMKLILEIVEQEQLIYSWLETERNGSRSISIQRSSRNGFSSVKKVENKNKVLTTSPFVYRDLMAQSNCCGHHNGVCENFLGFFWFKMERQQSLIILLLIYYI